MINFELNRRSMLGSCLAAASLSVGLKAAPRSVRTAFRSIRYGRAKRFGLATLEPFSENLIQDERGPVCPQRGGLILAMGKPSANRQDENCQVLSVFTNSRRGIRPVLVFIHGGAFLTGGGELAWYDGHKLAIEQDIVVVSISYRLGAFGFRLADSSFEMSPGFSDVVTALNWVQKYIHLFGGDPDNVTVCGQSAGSAIAMILNDYGYGGRLYRRIIAMSGNHLYASQDQALEHSRIFDATLGHDPDGAPPEAIVEAQGRIRKGSSTDPFWLPIAPSHRSKIGADVMAGSLREDLSFVVILSETGRAIPGTSLERFRTASLPLSDEMRRYAREAAADGRQAYAYSFDWNGPDTGMGNVHTIDLAFLFGDWNAWKEAPMLGGLDRREYELKGKLMRAQWAAYARWGNPQVPGGPEWLPASAKVAPLTRLT